MSSSDIIRKGGPFLASRVDVGEIDVGTRPSVRVGSEAPLFAGGMRWPLC
jgi:hypothetical protein